MAEIPLVRARYAHSFAVSLDRLGVPTESLLNRHHLSPNLIEKQDGLITAHQLWAFAGHAAEREGLAELGLLAGQVPVIEHGDFGKMVYQGLTLYDAIETFCTNAVIEYSRADFYLRLDGEQAWFCRGPIDGEPMQRQQVELYVLIMMIDTIRLGAGFDWQPNTIHLQNNDQHGLADVSLFRNANVRFGCQTSAIGFPAKFLANPLHGNIAAFTKAEDMPNDITLSTDFGQSLREVLRNHLGHIPLTLSTTAEMIGLTPRTLQRELSKHQLSYQELLDQLRYEKALPLLRDKKHKLFDIALDLGYSDSAHFTRAFRRWAGMTPREYRKQHVA